MRPRLYPTITVMMISLLFLCGSATVLADPLIAGHAYTLTGTYTDGSGDTYVTTRNEWGAAESGGTLFSGLLSFDARYLTQTGTSWFHDGSTDPLDRVSFQTISGQTFEKNSATAPAFYFNSSGYLNSLYFQRSFATAESTDTFTLGGEGDNTWRFVREFTNTNRGTDTFSGTYSIVLEQTTPVPEPTTMLLFGTGLIALAGIRRKKTKKQSLPVD